MTEHAPDPRRQPGRAVQERGADRAVVLRPVFVLHHAGLEPLAPVVPAVPQVLLVRRGLGPGRGPLGVALRARRLGREIDPRHHVRPELGEDGAVAVGPPHLPGDDHDGIPPSRRPLHAAPEPTRNVAEPQGVRHVVRHTAVLELLGGQVAQPLEGEAGNVIEEGRSRDEQLPVAGPARPLALGAVGGDLARVVAERPLRDVVQRVDPLVAAAEPPGVPEVGVHHHSGDVVDRQRPGVAFDPGELEAVGGVPGLEHLVRRTGRDHVIDHADRRRCAGEIERRIEMVLRHVAVGVDHLAVDDGHFGALRTEIAESQPSVDVLAQVDHVSVGGQAGDRDRPQLLHPARRWRRRAGQVGVAVSGDRDGFPCDGLGPVILALARHEVGMAEGPGRRLPSFVRRHDDCRPRGAGPGRRGWCRSRRLIGRSRCGRATTRRSGRPPTGSRPRPAGRPRRRSARAGWWGSS